MQYPYIICCIYGKEDLSRWGIPISMDTALAVASDWSAHENHVWVDMRSGEQMDVKYYGDEAVKNHV